MLERNAMKVARYVLRRAKSSNRFSLSAVRHEVAQIVVTINNNKEVKPN